jgi:hypothetical protein
MVVPGRGHPQQTLTDQVGGEQLLIAGHLVMFAWLSIPWHRVSRASKLGCSPLWGWLTGSDKSR